MKTLLISLLSLTLTSGCVVLPDSDETYRNKCEISSDRKVLRIVDLAKESNTYYSIQGLVLLPITTVVSGTYVAVNNIYHLGEEKIICD